MGRAKKLIVLESIVQVCLLNNYISVYLHTYNSVHVCFALFFLCYTCRIIIDWN